MGRIRAEFSALESGEEAFRQALWELESLLEGLEGELERSLALWEGRDQKAYAAARAKWDEEARDLRSDLARLHQALVRARKNYRHALETNVRMWGR